MCTDSPWEYLRRAVVHGADFHVGLLSCGDVVLAVVEL